MTLLLEMFSNLKCDINRFGDGEKSLRGVVRGLLSQGFQAIVVYRFFHWLKVHNIPTQPVRFVVERIVEITTGISIPADCEIGKGLRIHHYGGIILHPSVKIGDNCTIYHGVTIGDRGGSGGVASIGNNVMIGAGAKIIGEIAIGHNCRIGANVVITSDMSDNSIAHVAKCGIYPAQYL